MGTELVAFDMAGTTVRDDGIVESAFFNALEAVGIASDDPGNPDRLAQVQATMGQSKIEVFHGLLGDHAEARRATTAFEQSIAELVHDGQVRAIEGVEQVFATLRSAGIKIALTTGFAPETQQLIVARLAWSDLVDLVIAPGDGIRGRPHPDLVLTALLRLGVDDVRDVAVVGDTANDLLAGWRAGAGIVAGVLTGAHSRTELEAAPHTHILESVTELPPLVVGG